MKAVADTLYTMDLIRVLVDIYIIIVNLRMLYIVLLVIN